MKFQYSRLVARFLVVVVLGHAFVQGTLSSSEAGGDACGPSNCARFETQLESLRQELPVIAQITQVLDHEDRTVPFTLTARQQVRIFSIGEGGPGEMFDYGWIEDDKGSRVWEM